MCAFVCPFVCRSLLGWNVLSDGDEKFFPACIFFFLAVVIGLGVDHFVRGEVAKEDLECDVRKE